MDNMYSCGFTILSVFCISQGFRCNSGIPVVELVPSDPHVVADTAPVDNPIVSALVTRSDATCIIIIASLYTGVYIYTVIPEPNNNKFQLSNLPVDVFWFEIYFQSAEYVVCRDDRQTSKLKWYYD